MSLTTHICFKLHCILYKVYTPALHAASHVDYGKRDAWFSVSMDAFGSVSGYGGLHGSPLSCRSSVIKYAKYRLAKQHHNGHLTTVAAADMSKQANIDTYVPCL